MIGTAPDREIVEWEKTDEDGTMVYIIEYSKPVPEPKIQSSTLFGASTSGSVPAGDRQIQLPDGEQLPASELVFDAEGTTLRVRHRGPSTLAQIRRTLFPWW